jgi:hypothetical protein
MKNIFLHHSKLPVQFPKCWKPQWTGKRLVLVLVLPATIDTAETVIGESYAKELCKITLTGNTVGRRISDITFGICWKMIRRKTFCSEDLLMVELRHLSVEYN